MKKKEWGLVAATCVLCSIFMLPRILSAQFGLLDDGVLLLSAQAALKDLNLIWFQFQSSGRFLPTALIFRTLVFGVAGFSPVLWYLWSLLQLIIITLELFFLARVFKASLVQTALCVLIFLASPSLVENFYTLSKSEILLLLFAAGSILCAYQFPKQKSRAAKAINLLCTFILLLLCFGAKETAIVLPVMFVAWIGISWFVLKGNEDFRASIQTELSLLILSIVAGVVYWGTRAILGISNPTSNNYVTDYQIFNVKKLLENFMSLIGWIARDFPYLIPIFLAILLIKPLRKAGPFALVLKWSVWIGVWGGILLPWNIVAYYLLPFLFGAALLSGMVLGEMIHIVWPGFAQSTTDEKQLPHGFRRLPAMMVVLTLLLVVPPLVNSYAYATEQLSFDLANWRFVKNMAALPPNSRLIITLPKQVEYYSEIRLMVNQILNRPDIQIEPYQPPILVDQQANIYIASLIFHNHVLPSVRGYHGPSVMTWTACTANEADATKKVFSAKVIRPVVDIGLHRLLSFLSMGELLNVPRDVFVNTTMLYGWEVNQFLPTKAHPSRPGVYQNGVFVLETTSGNIRSVVYGVGDEIPLSGDMNGDGFSDLVLYDSHTNAWYVDLNLDGKDDMAFTIAAMVADDIPLLGDWDGNGTDTPGFYHPANAQWVLFNSIDGEPASLLQYGIPSDVPIVGDWNGDGLDDTGIFRPESGYGLLISGQQQIEVNGLTGTIPVPGFWDATSKSQLAFVKDDKWMLLFPIPGCNQPNPPQESQFTASGIPLSGVWRDQ